MAVGTSVAFPAAIIATPTRISITRLLALRTTAAPLSEAPVPHDLPEYTERASHALPEQGDAHRTASPGWKAVLQHICLTQGAREPTTGQQLMYPFLGCLICF